MTVRAFEQVGLVRVMSLVEAGAVSIVKVVYVDTVFVTEVKIRYGTISEDLNQFVPDNSLEVVLVSTSRNFSRLGCGGSKHVTAGYR